MVGVHKGSFALPSLDFYFFLGPKVFVFSVNLTTVLCVGVGRIF